MSSMTSKILSPFPVIAPLQSTIFFKDQMNKFDQKAKTNFVSHVLKNQPTGLALFIPSAKDIKKVPGQNMARIIADFFKLKFVAQDNVDTFPYGNAKSGIDEQPIGVYESETNGGYRGADNRSDDLIQNGMTNAKDDHLNVVFAPENTIVPIDLQEVESKFRSLTTLEKKHYVLKDNVYLDIACLKATLIYKGTKFEVKTLSDAVFTPAFAVEEALKNLTKITGGSIIEKATKIIKESDIETGKEIHPESELFAIDQTTGFPLMQDGQPIYIRNIPGPNWHKYVSGEDRQSIINKAALAMIAPLTAPESNW